MIRRTPRLVFLATLPLFFISPAAATADSSVPPSPTGLTMTRVGSSATVTAGGWIGANKIDLRFHADVTGDKLTPQVEVEPVTQAFTGTSTASGPSLTTTGTASVVVGGLSNGATYHWQARLVDTSGTPGAWVAYGSTPSTTDFGVDLSPPSRPVITSPSNPRSTLWYHNRVVTLHWQSTDAASGVKGYAFVLRRRPSDDPPNSLTSSTGARVTNLADGVWYVSVRAVDNAGNASATSSFRFQLDRKPARVTWLSPSHFTFNPYRGPITARFRVSELATVHLQLWRVGSHHATRKFTVKNLRAGRIASITWHGKTSSGNFVPRGDYYFAVRAFDRAGNLTHINAGNMYVDPAKPQVAVGGVVLYPNGGHVIIVVLSQQTLYAYNGTHLAVKTYITSGNPALPTPVGNYHIMAKYHPYEMVSPWPPGSPYYYAPSWMQYAMLFRSGGYFIHDAPWRSVFGPGSNGPGQPGTNYGGSHGCVNVPPGPMTTLWGWTAIGTPVHVVP